MKRHDRAADLITDILDEYEETFSESNDDLGHVDTIDHAGRKQISTSPHGGLRKRR